MSCFQCWHRTIVTGVTVHVSLKNSASCSLLCIATTVEYITVTLDSFKVWHYPQSWVPASLFSRLFREPVISQMLKEMTISKGRVVGWWGVKEWEVSKYSHTGSAPALSLMIHQSRNPLSLFFGSFSLCAPILSPSQPLISDFWGWFAIACVWSSPGYCVWQRTSTNGAQSVLLERLLVCVGNRYCTRSCIM